MTFDIKTDLVFRHDEMTQVKKDYPWMESEDSSSYYWTMSHMHHHNTHN